MAKKRRRASVRHHQQTGGILGRAENTVINGGNFTSVVDNKKTKEEEAFSFLQEHVATSAFHNSAQRLDPPRCHEGTRQAVLDEIFEWIVANVARSTFIAWLNGAAGAGKSAICQSMAEMCIARGFLVASFFFFRTDSSRNSIDPLVATLAYQLIQLLPETKDLIVRALVANPLLFKQNFETQLNMLIARPLRRLRRAGSEWKLLLIIDGLDECKWYENQMNLIRVLAKLLRTKDIPLIVLFGSRQENQIKMTFNSPDIEKILLRLPLDDHYLPDSDIRLFLNDSFREIKQTHPLNDHLRLSWPAKSLVQEIVDKSSGQFIYASVVIKFVSDPRSNPARQLDIVRGLRPSGRSTPFAQLDALYRHIFSQVQDLPTTLSLLAYVALGQKRPYIYLAASFFLEMQVDDLHTALADLTSVIICKDNLVTFLHASLPDFLLDPVRSQEYCVSAAVWCTRLSFLWFKNVVSGRIKMTGSYDSCVIDFLTYAEGSPDLRASILTFEPEPFKTKVFLTDPDLPVRYLTAVKRLEFGDGGDVYRHQVKAITRYIKKSTAGNSVNILSMRSIPEVMRELEQEEAQERQAKKLSRRIGFKAWVKRFI